MAFPETEAAKLLNDTGRLCCICRTQHSVSLHHIVPTEMGGTDDIENAIPLCPNCHDAVHGSRASGRTTRAYTPQELRLHRQRTIESVRGEVKDGAKPLRQQIRDELYNINPVILQRLDAGASSLCVMVNEMKLPDLVRLSKHAAFSDYLSLEPTGNKSFGAHNIIGGHLNDVADAGELTGLRLTFKPALGNQKGDEYLCQEQTDSAPARTPTGRRVSSAECDYDCFICHASEDKAQFVDALAHGLRNAGCMVWYDNFVLKVGDSLRRKIDEGLLKSRHGVVVLSRAFFKKEWPQKELDGLAAMAKDRGILPVWLGVTKEDIVQYSPTLADIVAAKASDGLTVVIRELLDAMGKPPLLKDAPVAPSGVTSATAFTKQESELLAAAAQDGKLYLLKAANAPTWGSSGDRFNVKPCVS